VGKQIEPGTPAPESGIVKTQSGDSATVIKGRPMPPTPKPGQTWHYDKVTDPSHKPGR
jgi:hypothetical protein